MMNSTEPEPQAELLPKGRFFRAAQILGAILDRLTDWLGYFVAGVTAFLMLAVVYDVVMRYIFSRPTVWVGDASEYTLYISTVLALGWILKKEGHVVVDILTARINLKTRVILEKTTSFVGFIIWGVVAVFALISTWQAYQAGDFEMRSLRVPKAALLVFLPVGLFFLAFQFLRRSRTPKGHF